VGGRRRAAAVRLGCPGYTNSPRGAYQRAPGGRPRRVIVSIVVVIVLLGLIVFFHLSGAVGPGVH